MNPNGRIRQAYVHPLSRELAGMLFGPDAGRNSIDKPVLDLLLKMAAVLDNLYKRRWGSDYYAACDWMAREWMPAQSELIPVRVVRVTYPISNVFSDTMNQKIMAMFDEHDTPVITRTLRGAIHIEYSDNQTDIIPCWYFAYADRTVRVADFFEAEQLDKMSAQEAGDGYEFTGAEGN